MCRCHQDSSSKLAKQHKGHALPLHTSSQGRTVVLAELGSNTGQLEVLNIVHKLSLSHPSPSQSSSAWRLHSTPRPGGSSPSS